jgi:hypothetical protein
MSHVVYRREAGNLSSNLEIEYPLMARWHIYDKHSNHSWYCYQDDGETIIEEKGIRSVLERLP